MREIRIKNKSVYIVESHNQVLEAWERASKPNVFSLDFHTDTREAFQNYSYWRADSEVKSGRCSDSAARNKELTDQKINQYLDKKITINQINDNLKHDEHLDFAVRTEMIDTAFILSVNSNTTSSNPNVYIPGGAEEYGDQRIIEFSPPCVPGCLKQVHDEACRTLRADNAVEDALLENAVSRAESYRPSFFSNYILDIDCDYFNTEKSLYPENTGLFKKLIRDSEFITIAMEPECVKICRHEGSSLDSDTILDRLMSIIGH